MTFMRSGVSLSRQRSKWRQVGVRTRGNAGDLVDRLLECGGRSRDVDVHGVGLAGVLDCDCCQRGTYAREGRESKREMKAGSAYRSLRLVF